MLGLALLSAAVPGVAKDSPLLPGVHAGEYGSSRDFQLSNGIGRVALYYMIGTAGVVYTSVLGVKSYDYGKIN